MRKKVHEYIKDHKGTDLHAIARELHFDEKEVLRTILELQKDRLITFDKYRLVDIAFSANYNGIRFAQERIGISHDTSASVNRINAVWILNFALIPTVDY